MPIVYIPSRAKKAPSEIPENFSRLDGPILYKAAQCHVLAEPWGVGGEEIHSQQIYILQSICIQRNETRDIIDHGFSGGMRT